VHFIEDSIEDRPDDSDGTQVRAAGAQRRRWVMAGAGLTVLALGGCSTPRGTPPAGGSAPRPGSPAQTTPSAPAPPAAARPTAEARNWSEYQVQAARRLVKANPDLTYTGTVPETLLAIPVLEVDLYVDGSIQAIRVQRQPRQAVDTVQLAIAAVRRAAPFAPVGHLPKPWRFTEVFLFDDNRRFKPRSLD
jgi:hypothetical protein